MKCCCFCYEDDGRKLINGMHEECHDELVAVEKVREEIHKTISSAFFTKADQAKIRKRLTVKRRYHDIKQISLELEKRIKFFENNFRQAYSLIQRKSSYISTS